MRRGFRWLLPVLLLLGGAPFQGAQGEGAPPLSPERAAAIVARLEQRYPLAHTAPGGTDIATAGAVLELRLGKVVLNKVSINPPTPNVFAGGGIRTEGLMGALGKLGSFNFGAGAASKISRSFAAGEKFWVVAIAAQADGVVFTLQSDPIEDVSYHGTLRIPYGEGATPGPEQALEQVARVLHTDTPDGGVAAAPPAPDAAGQAPVTIRLGQTVEEVVGSLGPPTRIVDLGERQFYFYPDMKVTFVGHRVSDVQ